jgi:uncharacterized membrane protein
MAQTPPMEQTAPQRLAIEDAVVVEAPIQEVYRQWSDFTRFPEHMRNIISVTRIGDNRYHWIGTFFSQRQEWDTDVIVCEDPHSLAWSSVAGQNNSGQLTFTPCDDGATEVRLRMEVTAPAGIAPKAFDKLAHTARKRTHRDLQRYRIQMQPQRRQKETSTGTVRLALQLGVAAAAAGAGGYVAYFANQRLKQAVSYRSMPSQTHAAAAIASWSLVGGAAGSIVASVALHAMGRRKQGLFVG